MTTFLTLSGDEFDRLKAVYRPIPVRDWLAENEGVVFPLRWDRDKERDTFTAKFPSDAAATMFKLRWL